VKISRIARISAIGAVAALALAGCAANESSTPAGSDAPSGSALEGTVKATGASSQTAAQEAWTKAFQEANTGATVVYEPTGSGTGRENFLSGASNFIGSDRAFNDEEIAAGGFKTCTEDDIVEVPVYISPVALAFNLDGVDTLNLDATTIASIFAAKIAKWNDPAIATLNPEAELPDIPVAPVHRSDKSGTTGTFTAYLHATAPDVWTWEDDDTWPIQAGESAQQTQGVAQAISAGAGTIGYLDASQIPDGAGQVHVKSGDSFVAYSAEAAASLVESAPLASGRGESDIVFDVDPASAADGSYPIALVSYAIGCVNYEDKNIATLVKSYFEYIISADGQKAAADNAGSAPISDAVREKAQAAVDRIVTE